MPAGYGMIYSSEVKLMNLTDYSGNAVRLTDERLAHIKEHPEMDIHTPKINETLSNPDGETLLQALCWAICRG